MTEEGLYAVAREWETERTCEFLLWDECVSRLVKNPEANLQPQNKNIPTPTIKTARKVAFV